LILLEKCPCAATPKALPACQCPAVPLLLLGVRKVASKSKCRFVTYLFFFFIQCMSCRWPKTKVLD
jgi:hypothetical protein